MPFLGLYWTASQPDMLSHINAQSKDQSMKFFEKKLLGIPVLPWMVFGIFPWCPSRKVVIQGLVLGVE